jgi:hypothetical protein
MPPKDFISVAIAIQFPYDNDEVSGKPCARLAQIKIEGPSPNKISFKYAAIRKNVFLL